MGRRKDGERQKEGRGEGERRGDQGVGPGKETVGRGWEDSDVRGREEEVGWCKDWKELRLCVSIR